MSSENELFRERLEKLRQIEKEEGTAYPANINAEIRISAVRDNFSEFESSEQSLWLAGRVTAIRGHGALIFADINDGTGQIQAYLKSDEMEGVGYDRFTKEVDRGDFIEIFGPVTKTKRGEISIKTTKWRMLAKSLRPLPEKWFGIKDEELRYRKRYLDLLLNDELREMFYRKAKFWQAAQEFLIQEGFIEVHTPTLEVTTGGAEAAPFETHHNDFDMDVYLRISVGELWQKRLMAAGFPRTFEIGRIYRNEGSSPEHLQEFTNIEFYAAYLNFDDGLDLIERHFLYVIDKAFDGQTSFDIRGHQVEFKRPFPRIDYVETVQEMTGINVLEATEEEMKTKLTELKVQYSGDNRERLTDTLWKYCRKQISGPVWLTGHPKLVSPLAKADPSNPDKTLRAQLIIAGSELNNCFAELNDPIDQRNRFELQRQLLEGGDEEAMMPDWEFVEMLEHGMPPTFGASTVSERLFAFLVNKTVRETQLFPLLKPEVQD